MLDFKGLYHAFQRSWLSVVLAPFAAIYGAIVRLRNYSFDHKPEKSYTASIPVISVGNITTGGTGKTPFAEYLLAFFVEQGVRPAYLSRGYGRKTQGYLFVDPNQGDATTYGDEALQVAHKFPHLPVAVCEKRALGIQRLQEKSDPDVIILDDAFQHRQVARDLEILMIDARRLPTEDKLLPWGSLREPLSGLKRAQILVINKLRGVDQIQSIKQQLHAYVSRLAFTLPIQETAVPFFPEASQMNTRPSQLVLFSGLGNNAHFAFQVAEKGFQVLAHHEYGDHYAYRESDFQAVIANFESFKKQYPEVPLGIYTTEKDFFRIKASPWLANYRSYPLFYVPIRLHWLEGEAFVQQQLLAVCSLASEK